MEIVYGSGKEVKIFENIDQELEAELGEMQQQRLKKSKNTFVCHKTDVECTLYFTTCRQDINPVELVHGLLEDCLENRIKRTRYVLRLIPFQTSCFTDYDQMMNAIKKEIIPFFEEKSVTYAIKPKIRNNEKINRDKLIQEVAELVPSTNKVDLKNPEYCIMIEVLNFVCSLSILADYEKLKRYNIEALCQKDNTEKIEE